MYSHILSIILFILHRLFIWKILFFLNSYRIWGYQNVCFIYFFQLNLIGTAAYYGHFMIDILHTVHPLFLPIPPGLLMKHSESVPAYISSPSPPSPLCVGDLSSGRAFENGCQCYLKSEAVINNLKGMQTLCQCDVGLLGNKLFRVCWFAPW